MKHFSIMLSILILSGCMHKKDFEDKNSIISGNTINIYNFKCDSIKPENNKLFIFFTDSKTFFDPVQSEQKAVYSISKLKINFTNIDSVIINFNMPNREDGNIEIITSPDYINSARSIYNSFNMSEIMDYILYTDSVDSLNHYLSGMNAEFAYFAYGEEAVENAFFGLNSLNIIYEYLQECSENRFGPSHFIIEKYKTKIDTYKEVNKIASNKLIEMIENNCKK